MRPTVEDIMHYYINKGYVNDTYIMQIISHRVAREISEREDYYRAYFAEHGLVGVVDNSFGSRFVLFDALYLFFRRVEDDSYQVLSFDGEKEVVVSIPKQKYSEV